MKSKLPDRINNGRKAMADLLLGPPFPILAIVIVSLENNLHISLNPLKKYFIYLLIAVYPAGKYYQFLSPLHEVGHYSFATFFKRKYKLNVNIWMDKNHTSCSCWKAYKNKDARLILCAGMLFKIVYCIVIIIIFFRLNIKLGIIFFCYIIWKEIVFNGFPIIKESDGYKLVHMDAFYNEKNEGQKEQEELYIKQIYPIRLPLVTISTIILLCLFEKVLLMFQ